MTVGFRSTVNNMSYFIWTPVLFSLFIIASTFPHYKILSRANATFFPVNGIDSSLQNSILVDKTVPRLLIYIICFPCIVLLLVRKIWIKKESISYCCIISLGIYTSTDVYDPYIIHRIVLCRSIIGTLLTKIIWQ